MAVRTTEMQSIIAHTKRIAGQTDASSPWTDIQVQDALDQHRLTLSWILMDHDPDYRHYYTRAHEGDHLTDQIIALGLNESEAPDFAGYTRVGFFGDPPTYRQGRRESSLAHTPDLINLFDGTVVFSTPPQVELFIQANAYNVYYAAGDLKSEDPGGGIKAVKSVRRGRVAYTYDPDAEIKRFYTRGFNLNRKYTKLYRA